MRGARTAWVFSLLILGLSPVPVIAQVPEKPAAPASAIVLTVGGDVPQPLKLTAAEFARLPRQSTRAKDHEGKESEFEGVPLVDVLKAAGVKFGDDLRGPALATYLVVEASDGYRAVFALPELDPASTDRMTLLADRRDGQPMSAKEGPLRVIVPGEKRHSRWVRQVIALKIGQAR
ncbi:MAG TPA: molybdopterin-dependent oxidoreductase [Isosphaeraceae bacterium]|jgi:DMSO/TMAO reductase YedYZ molybdopterin-dependent catalytic subunit|nr:molybdopterin-dependent oxidoreductase [Isosphaeraceae bacterium]